MPLSSLPVFHQELLISINKILLISISLLNFLGHILWNFPRSQMKKVEFAQIHEPTKYNLTRLKRSSKPYRGIIFELAQFKFGVQSACFVSIENSEMKLSFALFVVGSLFVSANASTTYIGSSG